MPRLLDFYRQIALEASKKRSKRNNQFSIQCCAKTALDEHFKKYIFGLTSGKLMEVDMLPTDLQEALPDKFAQDEASTN